MSDKLKLLTGKNPKDFEPVAYSLINNSDTELFEELVSKDDFLFDFVKQNVSDRLERVCNESNYLNLLNFLKYYSPSYEDFIVSVLVNYADEDLTDKMLEIFETGTEDEKTYCAKFFSYVQDPLALEFLKSGAYSQNSYLSANCASTLAAMGDEESYNEALEKLNSQDEFERLDGVRFLCAYGNKAAVSAIIDVMKKSSFTENIAEQLLCMTDLFELSKTSKTDALFVLNSIISGLGEIIGLGAVIDFGLYEFFRYLLNSEKDSKTAVVLLNARDKFETLTENDEYLFDESKDTKREVVDSGKLLAASVDVGGLLPLADEELTPESLFLYTAIELTEDDVKVRELLTSSDETVVLKAFEILKRMEKLTPTDKEIALAHAADENIKNIINAITV